jgi:hypothetical protein
MRAEPLARDEAEPARARDGSGFRPIIKEVTNGKGAFDFYHETQGGRGLALTATPVALAGADNAHAQAKDSPKQTTSQKSLYERLGGVFAIAAVVDHSATPS